MLEDKKVKNPNKAQKKERKDLADYEAFKRKIRCIEDGEEITEHFPMGRTIYLYRRRIIENTDKCIKNGGKIPVSPL